MKRPDHLLVDASYDTYLDVPTKDKHDDPDNAVVLLSTDESRPLQKRWCQSEPGGEFEKIKIEFPYHYEHSVRSAASLEDIYDMVWDLSEQGMEAPIRGGVVAGTADRHRRVHIAADKARSIVEVPRSWGMIDQDDLPEGYAGLPEDWLERPEEAVRWLIKACLPEPFHEAGVVVQWSSSMDLKGGKPKAHMFFRFSRPVWGVELKHWLGGRPVDPAVFRLSQLLLTANPLRINHIGKHLPDPFGDNRVMKFDGPPVDVPGYIKPYVPPEQFSAFKRGEYDPTRNHTVPLEERWATIKDDGRANMHDQARDLAGAQAYDDWPEYKVDEFVARFKQTVDFDMTVKDAEKRKNERLADLPRLYKSSWDHKNLLEQRASDALAECAKRLFPEKDRVNARSLLDLMKARTKK